MKQQQNKLCIQQIYNSLELPLTTKTVLNADIFYVQWDPETDAADEQT